MSKNPISLLQEYCDQRRYSLPVYTIEDHSLPSQPSVFKCVCTSMGKSTTATSSSKKSAKELSAKLMLQELGIREPARAPTASNPFSPTLPPLYSSPDSPHRNVKLFDNYVGELNEYCSQGGYPYPTYEDTGKTNEDFYVMCTHQTYTTKGWATTKKDAKQRAAHKMLQEIGLAPNFKPKTFMAPHPTHETTNLSTPAASTSASAPIAPPTKNLKNKPKPNYYRKPKPSSIECNSSMYVYVIKGYKVDYNITEESTDPFELVLRLKSDDSFSMRAKGPDKANVEKYLLAEALKKICLKNETCIYAEMINTKSTERPFIIPIP